jgi:hypothetical protein
MTPGLPVTDVDVPEALAASSEIVVTTLHAEGAQIYECKTGEVGKLGCVAREPIATLLRDSKTVGRHFAGPTWEHIDGSAVAGIVSARSPGATANDIPWLKLAVTERRGNGVLSSVTTILRINTQGGVAPNACDKAGALISVAYSTDYVFLRKKS